MINELIKLADHLDKKGLHKSTWKEDIERAVSASRATQ